MPNLTRGRHVGEVNCNSCRQCCGAHLAVEADRVAVDPPGGITYNEGEQAHCGRYVDSPLSADRRQRGCGVRPYQGELLD